MTNAEPVAIDLTDEERELVRLALNEYAGTAQHNVSAAGPGVGPVGSA